MPIVIVKNVTFSYARVFEARAAKPGQKKKFSACILVDKTNAGALETIDKAVKAAINEGIAKGMWTKAMVPALKLPLRDGDEELATEQRTGDEYKNRKFFNANATEDSPPGIVKPVGGRAVPITDPTEFFSGCYGHAGISFYPFKTPESKGVAAGLNNIFKLGEGERLDGRLSATSQFADLAAEVGDIDGFDDSALMDAVGSETIPDESIPDDDIQL